MAMIFWSQPVKRRSCFPTVAGSKLPSRPRGGSRSKALLFVILGGAMICTWGWANLFWTLAFLMRAYGLTAGESGAILGRLHLVGGLVGTILVAFAMHHLSRRPARVQIWAIASVMGSRLWRRLRPIRLIASSSSSFICGSTFRVLYMCTGPTYTLINNLSPLHLRAKVVSIFLFSTSLGYLILAPVFICYSSDLRSMSR